MIIVGNSLEIMSTLEVCSVDSIVTDPPYGLSFMGKDWDHGVPGVPFWEAALRVAKPGAFLLAFGGTRTFHRLAVAIEDAGWEIRDCVMWVYGSGFPKSRDIGKDIEKRKVGGIKNMEVIGERPGLNNEDGTHGFSYQKEYVPGKSIGGKQLQGTIPIYKITNEWEGWGTALKPAWEPIIVARKPIIGIVAQNVLKYGTGGINIDGCRVEISENDKAEIKAKANKKDTTNNIIKGFSNNTAEFGDWSMSKGRWPANLIHDGSDEVLAVFPENKSTIDKSKHAGRNGTSSFAGNEQVERIQRGDQGSAARFFYCAKASKQDRDEGCEGMESEKYVAGNYSQSPVCKTCDLTLNGTNDHSKCSGEVYYREMKSKITRNNHPTVKPLPLMRYLCRLVTPPEGTILDPFMGSGSTGKAAVQEGFEFIGIELEKEYAEIAEKRIKFQQKQGTLFTADGLNLNSEGDPSCPAE